MILKQGIIALIQLILKLFPALLRDLFACLIQKAEAWVEDTPPVVPFCCPQIDSYCIVNTFWKCILAIVFLWKFFLYKMYVYLLFHSLFL